MMNLDFLKSIKKYKGEVSGAFGDIGTDLPLLIALVFTIGFNGVTIFVIYGIFQIIIGAYYKLPIPIQPLKLMTSLVLVKGLPGEYLLIGGFLIGIIMLLLTYFGLLKRISQITPVYVVRGLQMGLGLKLIKLGGFQYLYLHNIEINFSLWIIIGLLILITVVFFIFKNNNWLPVSLLFLFSGTLYLLFFGYSGKTIEMMSTNNISVFPFLSHIKFRDFSDILFVLVVPQLALSIGNSIISTEKTVKDYFPSSNVTSNKLGKSYAFINIIAPLLGGVPACHGAGGVVGHYIYGGRRGLSVIIYGFFFLTLGLFWNVLYQWSNLIFPIPVMGVLIVIQGLFLIGFIKDLRRNIKYLTMTILLSLIAFLIPYGFAIAMIIGIGVNQLLKKWLD
jgi:hypothetical protein